MIKTPTKFIALLSGVAFLMSSAFAQGVATDPVGYVTTTTPSGDDSLIGLPLAQATALTSVADSVSDAVVTVSATLVANAYDNTHYVLATSGTNAGQWSEVVATAVNSITTADVLLAAADTFDVIPFWTLATAFPGGEGVGDTVDAFNPARTVSINDLNAQGINLSAAATYFYFPGPTPVAAGWYQTGNFNSSDSVRLSPETFITIRNSSGSSLATVISGTVPANVTGTTVVGVAEAAQDNQLVNPYPAPITLGASGLTSVVAPAADAFNPLDTVSIYDIENSAGQNISAAATYFYFAGPTPVPAGWYQTGNFAASDSVVIPAGGAFIVRKGAGDDESLTWNPPLPYAL
jgi:uncharacterized protein (TIGR02597 family)